MNVKQHLNNVFFSVFIGALLFGAKDINNIEHLSPKIVLFLIFVFSLRLKIYLDDTEFLGSSESTSRKDFKIGYITSIISWILFCVVGYCIWNPSLLWAITFLIISIVFITIWTVFAAFIVNPKNENAKKWFWFNLTYMIFLILLYLTITFESNFEILNILQYVILFSLIFTAGFDFKKSKSIHKIT
ncbi:hypothetical protein [Cyclobacterium sp.]|uniref:hypothetical protein n=1 Tax=Cyclobacterium sp. TaxID=1966343 RepID=UPI0019AB70BB|nr:hypothetical protein [Cyclobacterium sp.]MBD3628193.1 hypothetical protein [Cyclobacterium sp.]